ncbi:MAG: WYL domain-containing protein [Acidimicrobiia bacterium]|nr:WYL domain-containing protein [Acidimicrobiia bacterium]
MSGPRNAEERLRRLLVMLPWLMEVGEVEVAVVADRFDLTEAEVQRDLELVAMCGLPPFVDEMIDVFVDDGVVFVGVPRLFTRPLRLTAPEGFALLAAGRAAMELPGADAGGPLGRGLAKLATALGDAPALSGTETESGRPSGERETEDETAGVAIDLTRPEFTDDVLEATATSSELRIRYYSPTRDCSDDRVIVPRHVFAEGGNWYVIADDDRSGDRRTFRIDRIETLEPTGRHVSNEVPVDLPERFFADADLARAVLRLAPSARWVVEQYPTDAVDELDDGWCRATLPVASERWLSRLLIRLGPAVQVESPSAATVAAAGLASSILELYRERGG